jgi:PKHD-type hydroxylase
LEIIKELPEEWGVDVDFDTNHHYLFTPLFSKEECDKIIDIGDSLENNSATIRDKKQVDKSIRNSKISWIHYNKDTEWIYNWIWASVQNTNHWKIDIKGFYDSLQYTIYDSNDGVSKYDWHTDTGPDMNHRKISLSAQLSDPDDYSGGVFELERGGMLETVGHLEKGSAIMFPSILRHRVLPVRNGVRKSLVVWIAGPHIR